MLMTPDLVPHPIVGLFPEISFAELEAIRQSTNDEMELIRLVIARYLSPNLGAGPRAMIAARLTNVGQGYSPLTWKPEPGSIAQCPINSDAAGKLFGVHRSSVTKARMIRLLTSPETTAAVEQGKMSIEMAYEMTKPAERKRVAAPKKTDTERAEAMRARMAIYSHLKTAIEELTSLPLPSDVATIAKALDRSDLTTRKLPLALKWLQEFSECLSSKS